MRIQVKWLLLTLTLALLILRLFRVPAVAAKNLGMLSLSRVLISERDEPAWASQATDQLASALEWSSELARAQVAQQWLAGYQTRAAESQQNRDALEQIQTAWRNVKIDKDAEQRLAALTDGNDRWVEAQLALMHIYEQRGDRAAALQSRAKLDQWTPERVNANRFTWQDWQLEGYDYRPLSVSLRPEAYLVLYWRKIGGDGLSVTSSDPERGLYLVGNRLFQVVQAQNLLANGDFEWLHFDEISTKPPFYRLMFQTEDLGAAAYRLQPDERNVHNTAFHLINPWGETIFYHVPPGLQGGKRYLQIGESCARSGGFYGAREFVAGANQFTMLADRLHDETWRAYAGIFAPHVDGDGFFVDFGVSGEADAWAEFDDLGLFELPVLPP